MDDDKFDALEIVRYRDGPRVFGLRPSALKAAIDRGEIVRPILLSDSGRSLGWTRRMIETHQTRMLALSTERAKQQQLKPPTTKTTKTKKQKLHPAAKQRQRNS